VNRSLVCVFSVAIAWAASNSTATAGPINPGFDLFATDSPGTSATFTSPPFGVVNFVGVPLEPGLGNTDTIIQRTGPTIPSGGTGTFNIELVSLFLMSTAPVNIGGNFFDLYAVINKNGLIPGLPQPDPLPPSIGTLTIQTNSGAGGTFNSFFDVFVDIELTLPGHDPRTPGNIVQSMPSSDEGPFQATGTWSQTAPPGYPNNPSFPSGGFYVGGRLVEMGPMAMHTVDPATMVPEPASLVLLAVAGTALAGCVYRRRQKV
jgi:hypothetical protein